MVSFESATDSSLVGEVMSEDVRKTRNQIYYKVTENYRGNRSNP